MSRAPFGIIYMGLPSGLQPRTEISIVELEALESNILRIDLAAGTPEDGNFDLSFITINCP